MPRDFSYFKIILKMGVGEKISEFMWKDVTPQFLMTKNEKCVYHYRLVTTCVIGFLNVIQLVYPLFFAHMTNWGLTFCTITFLLLTLSYKYESVRNWAHLSFEISWCFEFMIFFVFWVVLFWPYYEMLGYEVILYSLYAHFGLMVLLAIDYFLAYYDFHRKHLVLAYTFAIAYGILNICLTLYEFEVYPIMTYHNTWSFLTIAFIFALVWISFEVPILINKCRSKPQQEKQDSTPLIGADAPEEVIIQ